MNLLSPPFSFSYSLFLFFTFSLFVSFRLIGCAFEIRGWTSDRPFASSTWSRTVRITIPHACLLDSVIAVSDRCMMLCVFKAGSYTAASPSPPLTLPAPLGTMYLTTPTGYPYTYHNGVAYFHNPEPNTHPSHWPAVSSAHTQLLHCQCLLWTVKPDICK